MPVVGGGNLRIGEAYMDEQSRQLRDWIALRRHMMLEADRADARAESSVRGRGGFVGRGRRGRGGRRRDIVGGSYGGDRVRIGDRSRGAGFEFRDLGIPGGVNISSQGIPQGGGVPEHYIPGLAETNEMLQAMGQDPLQVRDPELLRGMSGGDVQKAMNRRLMMIKGMMQAGERDKDRAFRREIMDKEFGLKEKAAEAEMGRLEKRATLAAQRDKEKHELELESMRAKAKASKAERESLLDFAKSKHRLDLEFKREELAQKKLEHALRTQDRRAELEAQKELRTIRLDKEKMIGKIRLDHMKAENEMKVTQMRESEKLKQQAFTSEQERREALANLEHKHTKEMTELKLKAAKAKAQLQFGGMEDERKFKAWIAAENNASKQGLVGPQKAESVAAAMQRWTIVSGKAPAEETQKPEEGTPGAIAGKLQKSKQKADAEDAAAEPIKATVQSYIDDAIDEYMKEEHGEGLAPFMKFATKALSKTHIPLADQHKKAIRQKVRQRLIVEGGLNAEETSEVLRKYFPENPFVGVE